MYPLGKEKIESQPAPQESFNGAAIVDERGNETPITEAMVQDALKALEGEWEPWSHPRCVKVTKQDYR